MCNMEICGMTACIFAPGRALLLLHKTRWCQVGRSNLLAVYLHLDGVGTDNRMLPMLLDFAPSTNTFLVKVPQTEKNLVRSLMREHGLDFSVPASTPETAVLFTQDAYAAVSFWDYATQAAKVRLEPLQKSIEVSWALDARGHYACPADKELWPFQKADLAYALSRQNTLIGDQPGLGKTPTSIVYANEIQAERVLVICPASIRLQWVNRIREWSMLRPLLVHAILKSNHGVHPYANWTICSYEMARSDAIGRALAKHEYDLLILDEAHYVKTSGSKRTRAIFGGGRDPHPFEPLARRSRSILALTGTPLPNRPREAYVLARNLCWDAIDWSSEQSFFERFNPVARREVTNEIGQTRIYNDERQGRHAELPNRLRANFMVRHLKKDVLKQLPECLIDVVRVDETGPIKAALKAESMLDLDPEMLTGADMAVMGQINAVRHQMGLALAPQAVEYIKTLLEGGEAKMLIFAHHVGVLDILEKGLGQYGFVRVDGRTGAVGKQKAVDEFQSDPTKRLFLGNLMATGTGTDGLQRAASHVVFVESSWVPGENQQGIDRLHRIGQREGVLVEFLVAPGSISERVLASALKKGMVIHQALDKKFKATA